MGYSFLLLRMSYEREMCMQGEKCLLSIFPPASIFMQETPQIAMVGKVDFQIDRVGLRRES